MGNQMSSITGCFGCIGMSDTTASWVVDTTNPAKTPAPMTLETISKMGDLTSDYIAKHRGDDIEEGSSLLLRYQAIADKCFVLQEQFKDSTSDDPRWRESLKSLYNLGPPPDEVVSILNRPNPPSFIGEKSIRNTAPAAQLEVERPMTEIPQFQKMPAVALRPYGETVGQGAREHKAAAKKLLEAVKSKVSPPLNDVIAVLHDIDRTTTLATKRNAVKALYYVSGTFEEVSSPLAAAGGIRIILEMLEYDDIKLRLYGIPVLRVMLSAKLNTVPVAHRHGAFLILTSCLADATNNSGEDAKSTATIIVQGAAAVDFLMRGNPLENRMSRKQGARLHAAIEACQKALPNDSNFQKLSPIILKNLSWALSDTPFVDARSNYTLSAPAAKTELEMLQRKLESGNDDIVATETSMFIDSLHKYYNSPEVAKLCLKISYVVLTDPVLRAHAPRMIDGGLVYAVVKAIVQYAHGVEYSCKEYSMRVLSALVNAPGYPGSASAPGQGGSIAAAAIFSEVSDSDRSKSLCQAIIIILDEASVFNDGMTVEDQRLRLILPAFELINNLLQAPFESLVSTVLAEDLRIAIQAAVEYFPNSKDVLSMGCRLMEKIAKVYEPWGVSPWVTAEDASLDIEDNR